jgi:hypothetical protein
MLECWNAGMLECWSAGMLEWGFRFSVLGGEALGAWRWALGGIGWRFADLVWTELFSPDTHLPVGFCVQLFEFYGAAIS